MSFWRERERLPGRHQDLLLDEVAPGHQLRHPVLHLDPGVHLHEVVISRRVHQELDGARVDVLDGLRRLHRRLPMRRRSLSVTKGEGASSTSFWWRRWIEHSRSPRCTMLPLVSPMIWISMWRGAST